MSFCSCR